VQSAEAHISHNLSSSGGVLVAGVSENSPANRAGVKQHDILIRFNDQEVSSPEEMASIIQQMKPDDKAPVSYLRGGEKIETTVVLGKMPAAQSTTSQPMPAFADPGAFWTNSLSDWLTTPQGRNSPPSLIAANVEYNDNNAKKINREFTGTREAIREEINADNEIPKETKDHLLRSLDQQTPAMFRFKWPRSFQEMFDRDWDDFRSKLDF
jgi:membrane-associated protease RseP (regulator of RpoE activity)